MVNDGTLTAIPEPAGVETVQDTEAAVPEVRVAITLALVLPPAVTVALDGLQATL